LARKGEAKRAELVADFETIVLHDKAIEKQVEAWRDEDEQIEEMWRVWYTQEDEKVCHICGPLHGKRIEHDPEVDFGVSDVFGRPLIGAPAHPNCRCVVRVEYTYRSGEVARPTSLVEDDGTGWRGRGLDSVRARQHAGVAGSTRRAQGTRP
jgi:hypothetical protein